MQISYFFEDFWKDFIINIVTKFNNDILIGYDWISY